MLRPTEISPALVDYDCTKPKYGRSLTVTAKIRNPQNNILEICSLKLFPKVAARIQQDLLGYTRSVAVHHIPDMINGSVIGELLGLAVGGPEKRKRQWLKAALRESVADYGLWIHKETGYRQRISTVLKNSFQGKSCRK